MNFISKIKDKLRYLRLKSIKPEMIGSTDSSSKNTRTSNMTHISNKGDNLKLGKNVFIGHFNYIDAFNDEVVIGDNVQITNYVSILTHSSHDEVRFSNASECNSKERNELYHINKIHIGENTYIGPHVVIMPGTIIGANCIVSAHSFLNGVYEQNSVIRGAPAKVIASTIDRDKDLIEKIPHLKLR